MDITVAVVTNPPVHNTAHTEKAARRYVFGDISQAYLSDTLADFIGGEYQFRQPIASPRTKFIHVVGFPDTDYQRITMPLKAGRDVVRATLYMVRDLSPSDENRLERDGEITLTWAEFQSVLFKKSPVDPLDPTQDELIPAGDDFSSDSPA